MGTKSIIRKGDYCIGACGFPPRPNTQGSSDVFIDGIGVHRKGDSWAIHCCCLPVCHGGIGLADPGNDTVFINGYAVCKSGDYISCGSRMGTGSNTVFCG